MYVCTCVPGHPCQAADLYVYIDLVVAFLASSYVFWWCNNRSQSLYLYIIIKICLLSIEKKRPSSAFGPESIIYVWFFIPPRNKKYVHMDKFSLPFNFNNNIISCAATRILLGAYTNCLLIHSFAAAATAAAVK